MEMYGVHRKCTSDCVLPLLPDRGAAVGDAKRCPHGQLYVCQKVYAAVPLAVWRRLSRMCDYREYKETARKLN